jgi:hypothetical protein
MRVEVNISQEDFRAFCKAVLNPGRGSTKGYRRLVLLVALWLGVAVVAGIISGLTGFRFNLDYKSAFLAIIVFTTFIYYFARRNQTRMSPVESGTILGPHTYEFTDAGVHESSEHLQNLIRWSGVQELRETGSHLFLMIDRNAGCIIPKRFLSSPDMAESLKRFVSERIGSAT